jgi:hypothetical protein
MAGSVPAQNLMDGPESVACDAAHQRYLVSSWANSRIVAMAADSSQSLYYQASGTVLGNHIADGIFYFSRGTNPAGVTAIDLTTDAVVWSLDIPGTQQCDGLATDTSGNLYVVQSFADRLYRVKLSDRSFTVFVASGLPGRTQDVTFDAVNNRLVVVGFDIPSPVVAVALPTGTLTALVPDAPGGFDGITLDNEGNLYASTFGAGLVYAWDTDGTGQRIVSYGFTGPSGLDFNKGDNILAVPNFNADRVDLIMMADADQDDIPYFQDNCPETFNPDQADADWDTFGDVCDECTDLDGDAFGDPGYPANSCALDNCPGISNPGQEDSDGDGVGDDCDNCWQIPNPDQADDDLNGTGNACEGCCTGMVGDANGSGDPEPTIGDITVLIDAKFVAENCDGLIDCFTEADINQSGGAYAGCDDITIGDISMLIDYLFIAGQDKMNLPDCP